MNRRSFMKGLAGVVAGASSLSKAVEPKYKVSYDPGAKEGDRIIHFSTMPGEVKFYKPKGVEKYDLIADLAEEMNNYDKKYPNQHIRYFIHCSYTGLAFLNDTGCLEKGENLVLWCRTGEDQTPFLAGFLHFVPVKVMPMGTESDINFIGRRYEGKNIVGRDLYTYDLVTTRCFYVNREEEGKIIAMGGRRPLPKDEPDYWVGNMWTGKEKNERRKNRENRRN